MIVNQFDDGWEIIYQRSHALLAAELVSFWQEKYRPQRWLETLFAIVQHDDEERYWDESRHLTKTGMPLDFRRATTETNLKQARYVLTLAEQQSRWMALMISCHNTFLMDKHRGEDDEVDKFLEEQDKNQQRWRRSLDVSKSTVEDAYALVRWGDRLSLILCERALPDRQRKLDITPLPDGEMSTIYQREDETLRVDPWIFVADEFTVKLEVRRLRQAAFESESELDNALENALVETDGWHFVK